MAITRLERKDRKNKARAINRQARIKQLTWHPEIRQIDIEAIKAEFAKKSAPKKKAKSTKKEETEEEKAAE